MDKVKTRADFDLLYNRDGSCYHWDCWESGVVLAYDVISPETATWFCDLHWDIDSEDESWDLVIVEDLRVPKPETRDTVRYDACPLSQPALPMSADDPLLASLHTRYATEFADMPASEISKKLLSEHEPLGSHPDTWSLPGSQSYQSVTFFDAMTRTARYTYRETSPGLFEHVFTFAPPESQSVIAGGTSALTAHDNVAGAQGIHTLRDHTDCYEHTFTQEGDGRDIIYVDYFPFFARTVLTRKERRAKQRLRRKYRAVFRRRKRGLA